MINKAYPLLVIMLAVYFVLLAISAIADTVYVKDGRVIKGNIIEENEDYITIVEFESSWQIVIYKNMISSISRSGSISGKGSKTESAAVQAQPQAMQSQGQKQIPQLIDEEPPEEEINPAAAGQPNAAETEEP